MVSNSSRERSEHGGTAFWAASTSDISQAAELTWQMELRSAPAHVFIKLSGIINAPILRDVWADVFRKKYWRKATPIVFDLTEVDVTRLRLPDIEEMVAMLNDLPDDLPGGRLLMIADSDVVFGKTRQYQTLSGLREGISVDVFRSKDDAMESLVGGRL